MSIPSVQLVAKICHQANKAICESSGDLSQKNWDEAEQWQRESAINGVQYALDNPWAEPEDMHKAWVTEKESQGWVYGEVKDADAKTHPCLIPYAELPEHQKLKDAVFQSIVDAVYS